MRISCIGHLSRKRLARRLAGLALGAVLGIAGLHSPVSAATYTAANSAELTSRLTTVLPGDTIILNAGTTYTGVFTLTDRGAATNYITIQSSNLASLPVAGRRVVQADAVNMPKIVTTDGSSGNIAIKTSGAADYWKFVGIEITGMANSALQTSAVQIGANDATQTSLSQVPHHFIFDRCIVRAASSTQQLRRGIMLHSGDTQVINCRIADCKDIGQGDSQAVALLNGPGPLLIDNCFLEAASEHFMSGGGPVSVPNLVPSNITVTRNHFYKPLAWKSQSWNVKNHFELKSGNNVLLDGNILENCWNQAGSQFGASIVLKRVASGQAWTSTDNVTISNNIIRNVGLGVSVAGSTEPDGSATVNGWPKNVTFRNNLFHDITGPDFWAGNTATFFRLGDGGPNTKFDHNTAIIKTTSSGARIADIDGNAGVNYTGFEFTNNIVNGGPTYNFKSTAGNGAGTFNARMPNGMVYKKNVTVGVVQSLMIPAPPTTGYPGDWNLAPFNNSALAFPAFGGVLVNFATPGANYAGWKVIGWDQATNYATYPYNNSATDGKDIGCDIDQLMTKTAGCISGIWSAPPVTKTLKNGLNGYTGATSFHVRGQVPTSHFSSTGSYHEANSLVGTSGFTLRSFYKFDLNQGANAIPAGAIIDSAKLRMKIEFRDPATDGGASCYRMAPFTGFTINYAAATRNTYNGTNAWSGGANAGGEVADSNNDYIDTPAGTVAAIPATGSWMEFTVTSAVQAWVNGTANNGLMVKNNLHPQGTTVTTRMSTTSDAQGSAEYAELVVTYH